MMTIRSVVLLALMAVPAATTTAQNHGNAEARLQAAVHAELVEGDLERAIRLYRRLVADRSAGRAVVAMALVNLGRSYEKAGSSQARAAYARVVREFGDQTAPATIARGRLAGLGSSPAAGDGGASSLVLGDLNPFQPERFRQFDLSPDGEQVVFASYRSAADSAEGRQIYLADRSGTLVRRLPSDGRRFRGIPRWSPDGRLIAYTAVERRSPPDTGERRRLLIAGVADGSSRALDLDRPVTARDIAWTTGGHLALLGPEGTHVVDTAGRTVGFADVRVPYGTRSGGYSPDGRWIALDTRSTVSERDTDIWVVPAGGGRAVRVIERPGMDGMPAWSPDGRGIYFVSDRSGNLNVWRVGFDPETGQARGEPQQVTFYRDADVIQPVARGIGRLAFILIPLNTAIHVAAPARARESRAVARGRFPKLSPDGGEVFYLGEGSGREGIFAVRSGGGPPRQVTRMVPLANYLAPFQLSPNGRALAFFSDSGDSAALYTVPATGGAARRLAEVRRVSERSAAWSPDGTQLAYVSDSDLLVVPAAGGEPRRVASLHVWEAWTVRWSPDGRWLAALGYATPDEINAVFVVPAEGGEPRRLTPAEEDGYKEGLEWHPDGRRLSYMYYGAGGDGSRLAYLDGRQTSLLVDQPAPQWDYVGNWSPDGRRYYFVSTPTGQSYWGLYAFDEQTGATSLESPAVLGSHWLPTFSRDGGMMAWTIRPEVHQLWMLEQAR